MGKLGNLEKLGNVQFSTLKTQFLALLKAVFFLFRMLTIFSFKNNSHDVLWMLFNY